MWNYFYSLPGIRFCYKKLLQDCSWYAASGRFHGPFHLKSYVVPFKIEQLIHGSACKGCLTRFFNFVLFTSLIEFTIKTCERSHSDFYIEQQLFLLLGHSVVTQVYSRSKQMENFHFQLPKCIIIRYFVAQHYNAKAVFRSEIDV